MQHRSLPENDTREGKFLYAQADAFRIQESILNVIGLAIISTTPDGLIKTFNGVAESMLGYPASEVLDKETPLIFHDTNQVAQRAREASQRTGRNIDPSFEVFVAWAALQESPDRNEWKLIRKDGTQFTASVTVVALRDEHKNITGYAGIISDLSHQQKLRELITLQKEAEEKLQKVAEENLRFFNSPVNLNAVADFNGYLQRISPSWIKMLGWSELELKAQPVLNFVHPDDADSTREALRFISKSGKVSTFECRFVCKDGSYRWLLWGSASDLHSKMIYASAIDISERKKSEENILDSKSSLESLTLQLQEQNRSLDEFAHIISHNLRAPVNNIQALINLLDNNSVITDYKLIFDKLKNVSKNLSETMNELMDTLKAQTKPQVDLTEIRFKEVLDKVVQSLEGELIVAQASVTFDFNDAPVILYSKTYLESIFQNLLTNAIKYRSPHRKPTIHFRSSLADNHLELQVTDNGQGIDMERYGDKLFGLHKTFHDHHEARGVGLFLVKTQIEALGGSIAVTSEVDKGTSFTIRFN